MAAIAAALVAALCSVPARAQPALPPAASAPGAQASGAGAALSRAQVDSAAAALRDEPTLIGSRLYKSWQLKDSDRPPPPQDRPAWLIWLVDFMAWVGEAGRWLVWALGALAVALLVLRFRGLLGPAEGAAPDRLTAPTHVRDFDIRPQSLPADIGAAAWALWQAGQAPAAMSLLYRGALSHLVHSHAVPIRSASTEGDCLRLAEPVLAAPAHGYLQALVAAWRGTVYAGRLPADALAQRLCADFSPALGPPRASAAAHAAV